MIKPQVVKGTRDFLPAEMAKRNYIFGIIREIFELHGFEPLETPAMERLETLTGKYGDEGDQLIFKILNSGDYLSKLSAQELTSISSKKMTARIAEKALRYDLTVPMARCVSMYQHMINMPFKRYQIQPVWRADNPQSGRYREFFQCDADVVGSKSLYNEAELIKIYIDVFKKLGFTAFTVKINSRKILNSIAKILEVEQEFGMLTIAIDKIDKIGLDGVEKELLSKGLNEEKLAFLRQFFTLEGSNNDKLSYLKKTFAQNNITDFGVAEIENILGFFANEPEYLDHISLDLSLARGLDYYTGAIFEVVTNQFKIGSIGGGGRYDNLTEIFGLKDITGVGISFGAERILDVMNGLSLFPDSILSTTKVMIAPIDSKCFAMGLSLLKALRTAGVASEIYADEVKFKKQFKYANDKHIQFVIALGEDELTSGNFKIKNMLTGEQFEADTHNFVDHIKSYL